MPHATERSGRVKRKPSRNDIFIEMLRIRHVLRSLKPEQRSRGLLAWAKGEAARLGKLAEQP